MGVTTPFPSPDAIARAELLTRERFVYEGESLEEALAPGSARRRALDAALAEVDAGNKTPSIDWRRQFSLLLGLERLLSEEEPRLVDGTVLSAHQVDALSGTLTALLAESQPANGSAQPTASSPRTSWRVPPPAPNPCRADRRGGAEDEDGDLDDDLDDDDEDDDEDEDARGRRARGRGAPGLAGRGRRARTGSSRSSPRTPTPPSASGSSTPPAPARPSPRWASSRRRAPAAS